VRRLLTLGHPSSKTALQAQLQSRRPLALLVALVLCPLAFVLTANEAWALEQPSSTEQLQFIGESTTVVNGSQVVEPAPTPVSPPVSPAPLFETPPPGTVPPPSDSAPPKAGAEPALLQQTVVITTTGDETVGFSAEPVPVYQQSESARTEFAPTTTPPTTTSELASVSVSANPTAAPTPDLGTPETDIPAVAEEVPAALPAGPSLPSELADPVIPGAELQQQVGQGVVSQEQALSGYRSSGIAPASAAVRPLAQALNNVIGASASAAASAIAGVLGTVGGWLTEAPSSGEDSPASEGTWPKPFAPVSPEPLGSSFIGLFSGNGQASAGGAGATPLLGVLFLASVLLLRRDVRTYLISCELPKPSSALLLPLERPG
jgi:hypothetical protein